MVIFHSYVSLPEGSSHFDTCWTSVYSDYGFHDGLELKRFGMQRLLAPSKAGGHFCTMLGHALQCHTINSFAPIQHTTYIQHIYNIYTTYILYLGAQLSPSYISYPIYRSINRYLHGVMNNRSCYSLNSSSFLNFPSHV